MGEGRGSNGYTLIAVEEDEKEAESGIPVVQRWRTLLACLLVIGSTLLNNIAVSFIHERVPRNTPPLPDLFFSIFPEIPWTIRIAEWSLTILMTVTLSLIFFHIHRWIVIRRVVVIAAICYTFRAIAITLLQVPVPSVHTYCAPPEKETSLGLVAGRVFRIFTAFGMEFLYPRVLCGDLIVSGHTITLVFMWQGVSVYMPRGWAPLLGRVWGAMVGAALFSILLARRHYTVDVLFAYYLTSRVFWLYHGLLETSTAPNSVLRRVLWYPIFRWLEVDAPPQRLWENRLRFPPFLVRRLPALSSCS